MISTWPPSIGDRLVGRYKIESVVGETELVRVFRVYDEFIGCRVVCKVLISKDPDKEGGRLRAQYMRLRRISSQDVVKVWSFEKQSYDGHAIPFIVMEDVEGPTLKSWASSQSPAHIEVALLKVARALADMHEQHLPHGDLYSENILVSQSSGDTRFVIIDPETLAFGSSRPPVARVAITGLLGDDYWLDVKRFVIMAKELLGDADDLVQIIGKAAFADNPEPTAATIASIIESAIAQPRHRSGVSPISTSANALKAQRDRFYRRALDIRQRAMKRLEVDIRFRTRDFLGWSVSLSPDDDQTEAERLSIQRGDGHMDRRTLVVRTDTSDTWTIHLPELLQFDKRALTDDSGQCVRSIVSIRGRDVWEDALFLRFSQGDSEPEFQLLGARPDLSLALARCLEILGGHRLPLCVFGTDVPLGGRSPQSPEFEGLVTATTISGAIGKAIGSVASFEQVLRTLRGSIGVLVDNCAQIRHALKYGAAAVHSFDLVPGISGECEIEAFVTLDDIPTVVRWSLSQG